MDTGIISKSLAAVRKEPSESSEMVNQMLFGETFNILEIYKGWYRITGQFDNYPGWIDSRLTITIENNNSISNARIVNTLFRAKEIDSEYPLSICPGSILYKSNNGEFFCGNSKFSQIENPFVEIPAGKSEAIVQLAKTYINAPYLWGGRSPFGIDCSGLVQVVYRMVGVNLPRDASQQSTIGKTVEFIDHIETGDLAFFDNEDGVITHTGIITKEGQIIHSSGFVRIDKFDHQGIFNTPLNKYSHKLRVIKRVF